MGLGRVLRLCGETQTVQSEGGGGSGLEEEENNTLHNTNTHCSLLGASPVVLRLLGCPCSPA